MTERNIKQTLTAGFFAFLASLFLPQVTLKGCRQSQAALRPLFLGFGAFGLFVFYTLALEPDAVSVQGFHGASSGWEMVIRLIGGRCAGPSPGSA